MCFKNVIFFKHVYVTSVSLSLFALLCEFVCLTACLLRPFLYKVEEIEVKVFLLCGESKGKVMKLERTLLLAG